MAIYAPFVRGLLYSIKAHFFISIYMQQRYYALYIDDLQSFDNEYEVWFMSNN